MPALFGLWMKAMPDTLELYWWRKEERAARTFIVALHVGSQLRGAPVPDFKNASARFAPEEARLRLEEIEFVRQHRATLANLILRAYRARRIQGEQVEAYASVAAGRDESSVPWCGGTEGQAK